MKLELWPFKLLYLFLSALFLRIQLVASNSVRLWYGTTGLLSPRLRRTNRSMVAASVGSEKHKQ